MSLPNSNAKVPTEELSQEETIKFLGEEEETEKIDLEDRGGKKEEEKEEKEEDEEESEAEAEEDELKEIEEEIEEPDEEKLELVTPVRRREILAKYPKLFKEFPYLERAYYREQKFTEIVPTIEDAKTAVEKAQALDRFEKDLLTGNTENVLKAVKEQDQDAFLKIVDDYLPTLAKIDTNAYYHVLGTVIKNTIVSMVGEAKKSNNEALQSAAHILNQYVFGTSDFEPPAKLSSDKPKEDDRIQQREREFIQRQFTAARDDLNTKVDNILKATISAHIDPKESMTEYVRKNATREALEETMNLLRKDSRFSQVLDKLWEASLKDNFSQVSKDRIKSAFLSRAKTLLPSVIKKARNEALKGMGKRVRETEEETEVRSSNKGHAPVNRTHSSNSPKSVKEQAREIPANMRSIDYLMQD